MASATFTLNDAEPQIFEVRWAWWGREEYLYDGKLLQRLWDLTTVSGERKFHVNGHAVRIAWSRKDKFRTTVYVDERIRVEDMFPLPTRLREPFSWKKFLKTIAIWTVVGFVGAWIYKSGVWR